MPLIHIKTHRLEYRFEIHGKYTVIQGDSATGKSTFYDLVTVMFRNPAAVQNLSGVSLIPMGINATGCKYRLFSYEELIYDGIQKLKKSQH